MSSDTFDRRWPPRFPSPWVAVAVLVLLSGCKPASVDAPVDTPSPSGEIWLDGSCDLPQQLAETVAALGERGVVEVVGGQPYVWEFSCRGDTLAVTARSADVGGGGDPVLWLGAEAHPARIVPVRLRVGSGQAQLERRLALCPAGESVSFYVDLATGVVWGEG